jgi:hypothetical protein
MTENTNNNDEAQKILTDFFNDSNVNVIFKHICGDGFDFNSNVAGEIINRNSVENNEIDTFVYGKKTDNYDYNTDIHCFPKDEVVTATCFNDLYKWTMMPVILKLEEHFKKETPNSRPIIVTFGIDLRDQEMVRTINNDLVLQQQIFTNLQNMKNRKFDYDVFNFVNEKKPLKYLEGNLKEMFGDTLIDGEVLYNGKSNYSEEIIIDSNELRKWRHISEIDKSKVYVHMFKNNGEIFIEATGPWHKVTWL